MMAPQYERVQVLCTAINEATYIFHAPIDKVVVEENGRVTLWSGRRRVSTRPRYRNSSIDGRPVPGGGQWETTFGPIEVEPDPDE